MTQRVESIEDLFGGRRGKKGVSILQVCIRHFCSQMEMRALNIAYITTQTLSSLRMATSKDEIRPHPITNGNVSVDTG